VSIAFLVWSGFYVILGGTGLVREILRSSHAFCGIMCLCGAHLLSFPGKLCYSGVKVPVYIHRVTHVSPNYDETLANFGPYLALVKLMATGAAENFDCAGFALQLAEKNSQIKFQL
jgi:hypothetical protein